MTLEVTLSLHLCGTCIYCYVNLGPPSQANHRLVSHWPSVLGILMYPLQPSILKSRWSALSLASGVQSY